MTDYQSTKSLAIMLRKSELNSVIDCTFDTILKQRTVALLVQDLEHWQKEEILFLLLMVWFTCLCTYCKHTHCNVKDVSEKLFLNCSFLFPVVFFMTCLLPGVFILFDFEDNPTRTTVIFPV